MFEKIKNYFKEKEEREHMEYHLNSVYQMKGICAYLGYDNKTTEKVMNGYFGKGNWD